MIKTISVNIENYEIIKKLIAKYPSFRFMYVPIANKGYYITTLIMDDEGEIEKFNNLYNKLNDYYNYTHRNDCLWLAPLNTSSYFIGGATWGCTCGYDMFLIENDLE